MCISCGRYGAFLCMEQGAILHASHDINAYHRIVLNHVCFYLEIPVARFRNNKISEDFQLGSILHFIWITEVCVE